MPVSLKIMFVRLDHFMSENLMNINPYADDFHKYFFNCFSEKMRLEISCESSARQRIHMKDQALFSWKDKSKKLMCHLLQVLLGA